MGLPSGGTGTGRSVSRVVLAVRTEFILMVGFRVQAETSHFCEEIQPIFLLWHDEAEHKLLFMAQGSLEWGESLAVR